MYFCRYLKIWICHGRAGSALFSTSHSQQSAIALVRFSFHLLSTHTENPCCVSCGRAGDAIIVQIINEYVNCARTVSFIKRRRSAHIPAISEQSLLLSLKRRFIISNLVKAAVLAGRRILVIPSYRKTVTVAEKLTFSLSKYTYCRLGIRGMYLNICARFVFVLFIVSYIIMHAFFIYCHIKTVCKESAYLRLWMHHTL